MSPMGSSPMQKNFRRSTSKQPLMTGDEGASSVSYYEWANRSIQTASHAVRVTSTTQPGLIRRFFRRIAGQH